MRLIQRRRGLAMAARAIEPGTRLEYCVLGNNTCVDTGLSYTSPYNQVAATMWKMKLASVPSATAAFICARDSAGTDILLHYYATNKRMYTQYYLSSKTYSFYLQSVNISTSSIYQMNCAVDGNRASNVLITDRTSRTFGSSGSTASKTIASGTYPIYLFNTPALNRPLPTGSKFYEASITFNGTVHIFRPYLIDGRVVIYDLTAGRECSVVSGSISQ